MSITRTPFTRKLFSDTEDRVIKIIGDKKITISEIVEKLYGQEKRSFNPNNYVAFVVRQIAAKCGYHKLNWTLEGEGLGRQGKTVWKVKR